MFLSLREIDLYGMLVDPAAVLLIVCAALYLLLRFGLNRVVDLNRLVWRRPVVEVAMFVVLYSLAILTLRSL